MGMFSTKRKTKVYSAVFNMAGNEPINYLGTVVGMAAIGNQQRTIAEQIQQSLISGPAMRLRGFSRWAKQTNYRGTLGISSTRLMLGDNIDLDVIRPNLPPPPAGGDNVIDKAYIGIADYAVWAENWFILNHPDEIDDDFTIDINDEGDYVVVTFADGRPGYMIPLTGFDPTGVYLYVNYTVVGKNEKEPVQLGPLVQVASPSEWPSTIGMDPVDVVTTPHDVQLKTTVTTVVTYSDGSPGTTDETSSTRPANYNEVDNSYDSLEFIGSNPAGDETNSLRRILTLRQSAEVKVTSTDTTTTEVLPGGVVKKTVVTTAKEDLAQAYFYRRDTQVVVNRKWSMQKTFYYKSGSGNAELDAMFNPSSTNMEFYPFIPFMSGYRFIPPVQPFKNMPPGKPGPNYETCKKAYKKLTGGDYDAKGQDFAKNQTWGPDKPSAFGIFVEMGVPLNVKQQEGKRYIYEFFNVLAENSAGSIGKYNQWRVAWTAADESQKAWVKWRDAQSNSSDPLFGTPEPTRLSYPASPGYSVGMYCWTHEFNETLGWSAVSVDTGTGLGWVGAKAGNVDIRQGLSQEYYETVTSGGVTQQIPYYREVFTITRQITENSWRALSVYDAVHTNVVYKGKAVVTRASEALGSAEPSGMMIPLHERIFNGMPLKDATQMTLDSSYVRWNSTFSYQTGGGGFLMILMVVIVVVVTVITAGSGTGPSVGLLGGAAAVGGALGFTGYVAIMVGYVANAVAAMVLARLITMGAQAIFGEQLGAIIGAIASVIAVSYGTSYVNSTPFSAAEVLSSPETLMKLSVAAGQGYAGVINKDTIQTVQESQEMLKSYEDEMTKIQESWSELLGNGRALIDPAALLEIQSNDYLVPESSTSFLSRTLLTGSDIATMTNDIISSFAAVSTSTQLP